MTGCCGSHDTAKEAQEGAGEAKSLLSADEQITICSICQCDFEVPKTHSYSLVANFILAEILLLAFLSNDFAGW